ncbi:MAG: hypothetical protein AAB460_00670 [Patescibacteria group bacterium]
MNIYATLGIVAGALTIIEYVYYGWTIVKGETKPSRATWFIWAALTILIAFSYDAAGGEETVWVPYAAAIGTFLIAILSVRYGVGGWQPIDKVAIVIAFLCLPLWFLAGPAWVLLVTLVVDVAGIVPTLYKTYQHPTQESGIAWGMNLVGSFLNIAALGAIATWSFSEALYPFYMLLINGAVFFLIVRRDVLPTRLRF